MSSIRKATSKDISRITEILIFTKRMNYRTIFHNDEVSFGEMQVLPLAREFENDLSKLDTYFVYEDVFVKGLIHIENEEIVELYVDTFFQNEGIGAKLIEYAVSHFHVRFVWVLEKNESAIRFYERHNFRKTNEREYEYGTYIIKMVR